MKNRFGLHIGTENFSNSLGYPITIKYKNLNGAFDEYEFSLIHTDFKEPISKFQKVSLNRMNDAGVYRERFYGILVADSVEKMGASKYYNHSISAMEYAWMLDNYISPNISITKNTNPLDARNFYDPTILDVVNRVIKVNRLEHFDLIPFEINSETQDILRAKMSPEWTFEGETLFSILNMLFNYCNINLKFMDFNTLGNIKPFASEEAFIETFTGEESTYDPTTMHTTLITEGKNIELTRPIIEPEFTYNPVKSPDGFEISPNNLLIETRYPISNISGLVITPYLHATIVGKFMVGNQEWFRVIRGFIDEDVVTDAVRNNNLIYGSNNKPYIGEEQIVMEKALYDTLDQTSNITGIGNKLYFETGKENIHGLSVVGKMKSFWSAEENVSFRLSQRMLGSNKSGMGSLNEWPDNIVSANNSKPFMDHANITDINNAIIDYLRIQFGDKKGTNYQVFSTFYLGSKPQNIGATRTELMFDIQRFGIIPENSENSNLDMNFMMKYIRGNEGQSKMLTRVKYTPIISDRAYTFRERNKGLDTIVSHQNYNQTTNNTTNESLGNLLDKVSKSNSGLEKTITMFHYDDNEILKIGSREREYVITGGTLNYNIEHIDALYTFDQFYTRLNHYIGLREKWRQFEIPSEQVIRRQITLNSFAKFSTEQNPDYSTNFKNAESYLGKDRIDNLYINGRFGQHQILITYAIPTASYFVNNSIVASGEMTTSQILGTQSRVMEISGDQKRREQAVRMGLPANVRFAFGTGVQRAIGVPYNLPKVFEGTLTNKEFYAVSDFDLDADLRERLAFSMRMHHVDTTGNIFINQHLSATNGLTGGIGLENADLKIIFLSTIPWQREFVENSEVLQTNSAAMIVDNGSIKLPVVQYTKNQKALAVAVATENADKTGYDILYFSKEEVSNGDSNIQYYINFSDRYLNPTKRREYEWIRLPDPVQLVDFEATSFDGLSVPNSENLYGKVFKREWLKVNERHKANLGYIKPLYEELPPEDHPDTKAITTGFELENITSAEYEENSHTLWVSTSETISYPTFVTDDIKKLDPPKWLETAREQRTEYKLVPTENTPYRNYSTFEELPLTTDSNYKATVTNFTTKEVSWGDWDAGSYLEWDGVQDPWFYTYDVVTRAQLPAPKYTIETARVSNLRWNNDSDNAVTPDYNYFDKESDLPMNILQSNVRATVTNARLETGSSSEWDAGLSVEWTRGSVVSSPDYFAKKLSNLPKVNTTGLTAKVENLNWTKVNSPSYDMHELYFWPTFKELDEDSPLDRYDDRPRSGAVTHFDLVSSSLSEWDRNISEGKTYKNISVQGESGNVKTSVWYYIYKQHSQLFGELSRMNEESYIIRVHSGFGYDWWRVVPVNSSAGDPVYYDGIKNPVYYNSVRALNKMRLEIRSEIFSKPTEKDVWFALERQHRSVFDNLNNAVAQSAMIRYYNGSDYDYFHIRKDNALGIARKISTVNLQYFKGKVFNSGIRITLTGDIGGDIGGEVDPNDVWDLMSSQERQYFESLPQFYLANGIINVNTGFKNYYFKIEPLTDPMQDLQTYAFDKYINRYYVYGREWSVPNISLKDVPEGAEKDDLWYLLQERESQYFDKLDRFEHANGVIHMNNGYTSLYYKLVPVGNTQYNQYYEMGTMIEEYYISKEKL